MGHPQSAEGERGDETMTTDFSIRKILDKEEERGYEWLLCSRYKPPKLSRPRKKDTGRRRRSRTPRIPFSSAQLQALEGRFQASPYLSTQEAAHLSSLLRLSELRVKVWFQNRRARERRLKGEVLPATNELKPSSQTNTGNWSAFRPVNSFPLVMSAKSLYTVHQKKH